MLPSLCVLTRITDRLKAHNIHFALGGSALLYSLGLVEEVRDWDLCVEAPLETILESIKDFNYKILPNSEIFKSKFLIKVILEDTSIDIIGDFAIKKEDGSIHHVPVKISGYWNGIPMADPREWKIAYELMGRKEKALLIKF